MRAALGFFAALALAGAVHAQQSSSEVTDAQIAKYKKSAYAACREPGIKRGDPEARVDAFCSCMIATLEKSMKRTEWQQAYFYSLKKDNAREGAVVAPHAAGIKQCAPPPPPAPVAPPSSPASAPEAPPTSPSTPK